jgi:cold shock CspA family protein
MAIIRGKYDIFPTGQSTFVQNMYALTTEIATSPLLGVRILRLLDETKFQEAEGEARYISVDHAIDYFSGMNFERRAVRSWLDAMLKCGLCLSYDPTAVGIDKTSRVEIAPSGRQHLDWALKDWVYIEAMMEATPLVDRELHKEITEMTKAELPHARRRAIRSFLNYLLAEDRRYSLVPVHEMYAGQRGIVDTIGREITTLSSPVRTSGPSRYGRPFGRIATWFSDKGYGFVTPDGQTGGDAFVHVRDFIVYPANENVPVGTTIEFDLVDGDGERRKKAVRVAILD